MTLLLPDQSHVSIAEMGLKDQAVKSVLIQMMKQVQKNM